MSVFLCGYEVFGRTVFFSLMVLLSTQRFENVDDTRLLPALQTTYFIQAKINNNPNIKIYVDKTFDN